APKITESGLKFVVRNFPTAHMLVKGAFDMQKEIFKTSGATPKKAILVTVNDMFGQAMVDAFKARFPELGMPYQLVEAVCYDPETIDLAAEVAKAKATGADLVLPLCRATGAQLMVQEMVKQKWEPMAIITPASAGLYDQQFLKGAGKYSE